MMFATVRVNRDRRLGEGHTERREHRVGAHDGSLHRLSVVDIAGDNVKSGVLERKGVGSAREGDYPDDPRPFASLDRIRPLGPFAPNTASFMLVLSTRQMDDSQGERRGASRCDIEGSGEDVELSPEPHGDESPQERSSENSMTWVRRMLLPDGSRNEVSMP